MSDLSDFDRESPQQSAAGDPNANRHRMLTPAELAERWAMDIGTLANWRSAGIGPEFIRIGTNVRYRPSTVEAYEQMNTVKPIGA